MEIEGPSLQSFLAQFEPDGAGYLYRSPAATDPIRVTAAERQAFLDAYASRVGGLIWILLGGILASTLFMLADLSILHVPYGYYIDMAAYAASFIGWGLASQHLMWAPERALRYRIPPRERLGWFERHKRMLTTRSWRSMAGDGFFIVFWLAMITGKRETTMIDPYLLALMVVALALFGANVVLKLSLGTARR